MGLRKDSTRRQPCPGLGQGRLASHVLRGLRPLQLEGTLGLALAIRRDLGAELGTLLLAETGASPPVLVTPELGPGGGREQTKPQGSGQGAPQGSFQGGSSPWVEPMGGGRGRGHGREPHGAVAGVLGDGDMTARQAVGGEPGADDGEVILADLAAGVLAA